MGNLTARIDLNLGGPEQQNLKVVRLYVFEPLISPTLRALT